MKHLFPLLLACLLLCGCVQSAPPPETAPPTSPPVATTAAAPVGLYQPDTPLEQQNPAGLRGYPTNIPDVYGIKSMDNALLLFSGTEETTLTLLTGDELYITAQTTLSFNLDPTDPSLRIGVGELSYYDPDTNSTVVLNSKLKAVSHIAAPADLQGTPILSADRNTLYYCTADSVRAWDLESGIRRQIKEMSFDTQSVTGLHMDDTILQCITTRNGEEKTILFSTENGMLFYEGEGYLTLSTNRDCYCALVPNGCIFSPVFGLNDQARKTLVPPDLSAETFFLDDTYSAVTLNEYDTGMELNHYDLGSGLRTSSLILEDSHRPIAVEDTMEGRIYFLLYEEAFGCQTIYRWDTKTLAVTDPATYVTPHYTALSPDTEGLAQCQDLAREIGSKYGVNILIWEDALVQQPWDYDFEGEYLVPVIRRELERLDAHLSQYPREILRLTASHFSSVNICLVRSLRGTAESGSLESATGIQFFDNTDAYVVIAVGDLAPQTFTHELFHVMETHILTESIALDQWNDLNPEDFYYDFDYVANAQRDGSEYLEEGNEAFIDTYSMSYPKEDRARIMEYAMTPDSQDLFRSPILQSKLRALCQGIREAYNLENATAAFPWEQYLHRSLAPSDTISQ